MVSNLRTVSVLIVVTALGLAQAQSTRFFVAPNGNDTWPGTLPQPDAAGTNGPLATLPAAQAAARRVGTATVRTIEILPGDYYLDQPLMLNDKDNQLQIVAATPTPPTLYGGHPVTEWNQDGKLYWATIPGVKEGKRDFRALLVNGRLAPRARYPEEGTLTHESRFDVSWMSTTGGGWQRKPTAQELTTLKVKAGDLPAGLDPANAEITVYHMWDESLVGIKTIDRENRIITFTNPSGHPAGAFDIHKYVIWNTAEGLTHPGQWYLDRSAGRIVYWPLPGEEMTTARVIAPALESILKLERTDQVEIRNLHLAATTTPLKAGGFGAGAFAGAVDVRNSQKCRLIGLEVSHAAGQGICVSGGATAIESCQIHDIGACGIKATSCQIENNTVHHIGLIYPSAIGIMSGGKGCIIAHNEIYDTPYSAIDCGGENHRIEANKIHRAMLELHDGGAIYVFAGKNTLLRGNLAYDIPDTGGSGSSAYYLDERSTDCIVEENLSYDIQRPCHNHMAHGNIIRNNVFIYDGDMRLTFAKSDGFLFENNVLSATGKITFSFAPDAVTLKNNILFSRSGQLLHDRLRDYGTEKIVPLTLPSANTAADPFIEHWQTGRILWPDNSPAIAQGIPPLDVITAGPQKP